MPDTEEVTSSNLVRPTRVTWPFLFLALSGSALRPYNWPYCQAGRMPRPQTAGTRPVIAAGGRGRLQHRADARETASAPMGLLAGHRRVDDHLQVAIAGDVARAWPILSASASGSSALTRAVGRRFR
jgi:hypothetical protein